MRLGQAVACTSVGLWKVPSVVNRFDILDAPNWCAIPKDHGGQSHSRILHQHHSPDRARQGDMLRWHARKDQAYCFIVVDRVHWGSAVGGQCQRGARLTRRRSDAIELTSEKSG
jgi:hypothetical protein